MDSLEIYLRVGRDIISSSIPIVGLIMDRLSIFDFWYEEMKIIG